MKITNWIPGILMAAALVLAGCSKSSSPPPGQGVDLTKLQQAFAGAPADVQANLQKITFGLRFGQYADVFAALDQIVANPNLTPEQKKVVNDFMQAVKQMAVKKPSTTAP